jgi:hypothetical protein
VTITCASRWAPTANQKKLFFNLRKAKSKISALEEGDPAPRLVTLIAKRLYNNHVILWHQ